MKIIDDYEWENDIVDDVKPQKRYFDVSVISEGQVIESHAISAESKRDLEIEISSIQQSAQIHNESGDITTDAVKYHILSIRS